MATPTQCYVRPAKTRISLCWSESFLDVFRKSCSQSVRIWAGFAFIQDGFESSFYAQFGTTALSCTSFAETSTNCLTKHIYIQNNITRENTNTSLVHTLSFQNRFWEKIDQFAVIKHGSPNKSRKWPTQRLNRSPKSGLILHKTISKINVSP